ncbi:hypothetical protein [Bradyrhizobium sp. 76]|uniref:hypothetical protein n=1 Tax=Bradyrhizobium sp. 76 TaxID=2782680 RepID=UPI001FF71861|nr:hypothetical protein [Bradyrhizobium sp. 76]MCK1403936.1 hypothetical protein [Bradyrhizobium sp. 76]
MGRPIGSVNRQKPFRDALNIALHSRPGALRRIADQLLDQAERGELAAAREVIDRTDGRAVQSVEYGDMLITELSDRQLHEIASGALRTALPPPTAE